MGKHSATPASSATLLKLLALLRPSSALAACVLHPSTLAVVLQPGLLPMPLLGPTPPLPRAALLLLVLLPCRRLRGS